VLESAVFGARLCQRRPLFSEDDLVALMEARVMLEPALTRAAGERVTPEFLQTLLDTIQVLSNVCNTSTDSSQDPPHRVGRYLVIQADQFALDAAVAHAGSSAARHSARSRISF
jgi:DNA-binding FadR family transcriptional regulator